MNVPNLLTVLRILLAGVFVYLFMFASCILPALIVFVIASATDFLDGFIARRFNIVTTAGKLLDPLADKLMQIAALSCFALRGLIPPVMLLIMVVKEALMIAGGVYLYKKNIVVHAEFWGKTAALLFYVGVGLGMLSFFFPMGRAPEMVLWVSLGLSMIALLYYFRRNFAHICAPQQDTNRNNLR